MDLNHPAVELRLPIDGGHHQRAVPQDAIHFYWGSIQTRLKNESSLSGGLNRDATHPISPRNIRDQISWELTVNEESVFLLDELYRDNGKRGRSWWISTGQPTLPATVKSRVVTTGEPPTADGEELAICGTNETPLP